MRLHIQNIHLHLGGGALAAAMLSAFSSSAPGAEPQNAPGAMSTVAAASSPSKPPKIGERWEEHGGIYAGIARGFDGEPDAHLILLDQTPDTALSWHAALKWAESIGSGAKLPSRFESALLYANLQDQMDSNAYHWTSTQCSEGGAWFQGFDGGSQYDHNKEAELRARLVRRLPL